MHVRFDREEGTMSGEPALEIVASATDYEGAVPPPVPPSEQAAWYASDVREQYQLFPGVVATIRETAEGFDYEVREPSLGPTHLDALDRVREHFDGVQTRPPLTRQGALERAAADFPEKYRRALDRLLSVSPAAHRRIDYHALSTLRLFGDVTPLALDDRIELADAGGQRGSIDARRTESSAADGSDGDDRGGSDGGDSETARLVVHTENYAPLRTRYPADAPHVARIAAERLARYTVSFHGFEVPVVLLREQLLGDDQFSVKYAVQEPDLLPGDEKLAAECKERIWDLTEKQAVSKTTV